MTDNKPNSPQLTKFFLLEYLKGDSERLNKLYKVVYMRLLKVYGDKLSLYLGTEKKLRAEPFWDNFICIKRTSPIM